MSGQEEGSMVSRKEPDVNTPEWQEKKYGPKVQVNGETFQLQAGGVVPVYRRMKAS